MTTDSTARAPGEATDRRSFLKHLGVVGAGLALHGRGVAQDETAPTHAGSVPRRAFGRTGVQVSLLGVGGHAIGQCKTEAEGIRIIHEALESGVNFMDNAWEYHDGRSERWMGAALRGRRDQAFLMTKVCTHGRDAKLAMQHLEESLRRLQTDHLDLWQVHEVIYDNDPELHFAKGGVMDAIALAKQQGKVRFVGFTGHKDPSIHLKMLAYEFPFDSCQMPLGPFDATFRSFEQRVLPELTRRGIAPIGMKSLNGTAEAVKKGVLTAKEALTYVMSLPVATLVSGMNSLEVLRKNLEIARTFTPMGSDAMQTLRARCATPAADGRFELYKTSKKFDGPPGREQHGFPPLTAMAD